LIIAITGCSSGVGKELVALLKHEHQIVPITRDIVDLDFPERIQSPGKVDMLINCAGHDLGGKVPFSEMHWSYWSRVLNTNLISAMRLTQLAIQENENVTIVNITSTNVEKFYPGDLAYSLSKKSLQIFGDMLRYEHPSVTVKEVILGLTKTNFNENRHKEKHKPIDDLYAMDHLLPEEVAGAIAEFIFSENKRIRIAP